MDNKTLMRAFLILGFLVIFGQLPLASVHGQISSSATGIKSFVNSTSQKVNTVVSVNSSLTIPVTSDTLKEKGDLLRLAVSSFFNSGPNVLKTEGTDQPTVRTKIINNINKDTQNIEGIEATNAIVNVEINKAIKTINSSASIPDLITLGTFSTCKPFGNGSISCDNSVTIK
jgi:hypothetical protein